jgi:ribosomal protein S27AE
MHRTDPGIIRSYSGGPAGVPGLYFGGIRDHMERMLCESCAAVSYSAAARQIVDEGERCPRCGGTLVLETAERVPAGAASKSAPRPSTGRSGQ